MRREQRSSGRYPPSEDSQPSSQVNPTALTALLMLALSDANVARVGPSPAFDNGPFSAK